MVRFIPIKTLLKWGLGLGLFVYVLMLIDFSEFWKLLQRGDWRFVVLSVVIVILDRIWMGWKWHILLKAQSVTVSVWECVRAYYVASFVSLALPSSVGGDLVRLMNLSVPKGQREKVAASIVVEKMLAVFALCALVIPCLFLLIRTTHFCPQYYFIAAAGIVMAGVLLFLFSLRSPAFKKVLTFEGKFFNLFSRLLSSYQQFQNLKKAMLLFFICSFFEQWVPFVFNYVLAIGFHLPGTAFTYFMIVPLIYFVVRIPISVDGIGVLEAMFVFLFPLVGIPKTDALLLALVGRFSITLAHLLGGVFYFWKKQESNIS
jgi:uncharacterized protein (TIRG00374 family)